MASSVAGQWAFEFDPSDLGIGQRWFDRHPFPDVIALPGTTDLAGKGPLTSGSDPGRYTRVHKYYGPAWYERSIDIPTGWAGRPVRLTLERVIWESRAWIDGHAAGTADSLGTPHEHDLGVLTPGKHTLTIRIDNRMIHPIYVDGHAYTEETQTIWNGVVGKLELHAEPAAHLVRVRAFPDAAKRQVWLEAAVRNSNGLADATMSLTLTDNASHERFAAGQIKVPLQAGEQTVTATLPLPSAPKLWDEFSPNLYTLTISLQTHGQTDQATAPVGFRSLSRAGHHLAINGRTTFIRGNMEHSIFPLTGFPPTDVASWRRVFQIYKRYGFNAMRCHSWTPPEAAFTAADEEGIYIQAEMFWMQYALGSGKPVGKIKMRPGMPAGFDDSDQSPDGYVRSELRRVEDAYGNHPSLVFVVIGNELGKSVWAETGKWIRDEKLYDPRHWYAASTARQITPFDDFSDTHAVPKVGWVRDRVEPYNDWDYSALYARAPVPIIAHELGQWPTYPRWSQIKKFTGVVAARDLQACKDVARNRGVLDQDEAFHNASGALAIRLYKDEMESHLRTADCEGFSTLDMQDYPGQGEALVGWLDCFYDSKGIVTPDRFRQWCGPTVPLARLKKYVFSSDEPINGSVEVAHYGPSDLHAVASRWRLVDANGAVIAGADFAARDLATGTVSPLGVFAVAPGAVKGPAHVRLEVSVDLRSTTATNTWDLWVMSATAPAVDPAGVLVTSDVTAAQTALVAGKRVLLLADKLGSKRNKSIANFKPVYWSEWYFPWSETLGDLVQNAHPALAGFPTEDHSDWQWADLCKTGRGFVVDSLPKDFLPIVQPVPDFHLNHRLATVFELATPSGGKLLACGYDISTNLPTRPAARQLRASLMRYVQSSAFNPTMVVDTKALDVVFAPAPPLPTTH